MSNLYEWQGINIHGQKIDGVATVAHQKILWTQLENRGIVVLRIKKNKLASRTTYQKISRNKLTEFTRQFAILCQANVAVVDALQIIQREDPHLPLKNLLGALKKNIENGLSLGEAFQQFPQYFDKIYCGLIQAGEQSSSLAKLLAQLADYQEQMLTLRAKITKALFYPVTVALVAAIITAGLLIFVVPQFKNIFHSFGAELPWFTQTIMQISSWVQYGYQQWLGGLILGGIAYRYLIPHFNWVNAWRDRLALQLPIIGGLLTTAIFARWARILATLLNAGLPLIDALRMANPTIGNHIVQAAMENVLHQVSSGIHFSQALSAHACCPHRLIQMITVGESAGQLAAMLEKVAHWQQAELDRSIDYFSKWLEPAVMMILAAITGSLIIAMYLPIFKLGGIM